MSMARRSSLLLLVVLMQVPGLSRLDAQSTLSGTLRDGGGSLLPGVSVTATSSALAGARRAATDQAGRYSFGDLPDGPYTITFTLPGFVETVLSDIVLPAAAATPLDVVMRVGPLAETITIRPGSRQGAPLNPQDHTARTCTMRVMPVDPSIDQKILKEPDAAGDYVIKLLPPPCQASHPARNR
jgi:hypothetical protein